MLCLLLTYSSKHLFSFKKLLQTSGDVDLHPPITADKNKGRGYMTWSEFCSESVLQFGMRERGISHRFPLTIRPMTMSCGMRHCHQKRVPDSFVLFSFCFSSLPVSMSAVAFPVCYSLVPRSVLGSWRQAMLPGGQQKRAMKGRKVTEGKPVLDTTQWAQSVSEHEVKTFAVLIGANNVFPHMCGLWASRLVG